MQFLRLGIQFPDHLDSLDSVVLADNITKYKFTTFLIKFFEAIKTISGVVKDFTRLCYAAKLATQLQESQFRFNDCCLEIHLIIFCDAFNIASFSWFVR